MKILLVDDEPLELMNLKKMLHDYGEDDVIMVENGYDAIDQLKKQKIEIIYLDIKMPGLSGLETLEIIRRDWPETVVSIVSAYGDFLYAQKAIELGASFYMLKPFSKDEFIDTFKKLRSQWNEKQSKDMVLKQSILENMIYGEKQGTDAETLLQFDFIPEVVVTIKGKKQDWKQSFFNHFQGIVGFLAPEPFGDVAVFVTTKENVEITKEKLVQVNIEIGEELVYGIGVSNNLKNSFVNATKQLNEQDESIVHKSMQYIQDNYFKALTIADVAQAVHVSSSHLNRLLKKETSKTFTELLLNVRVNKAKDLLNQNFNIEVVSDMCGFNSSAYFAVSFKKFTGVSPSQYRKEIG